MTSAQQNIEQLLSQTKASLFLHRNSAFISHILLKLTFVWTRDIPTAAINSTKLFWNPDFFLGLPKPTRVTVLAHELWHNALLHAIRFQGRNFDIANQAADHVINLMLEEAKYSFTGIEFALKDPRFKGKSFEEVYDILIQEQPPAPSSAPLPVFGQKDSQATPDPDSPQSQQFPGNPAGEKMAGDVLAPGTKAEERALAGAVLEAVTAAKISGNPGSVPGETELTLSEFLDPAIPWDKELLSFFTAMVNTDRSYARPNRRYQDPILPGSLASTGLEHLIYYLDISGSISDEDIRRFNSEVRFIHTNLEPQRLTLVTFDTEIHDIYEFQHGDPFEEITVVGRGGTDLDEVYNHIAKHRPTAAVIFTDLYVDIPDEAPVCPLIWACLDNPSAEVPYGRLIHIPSME
jgi:predicted metal-dependent peptidase